MCKKPSEADYPQIFHLLERAFAPSVSESCLVKRLKKKGRIVLDYAIEQKGVIVAYICYSLAFDNAENVIGCHLAPLAVLPGKQQQGLGQMIIRESLKVLPQGEPVYVLGDPDYYRRFGFRIDKTQKCSFDPDGSHFMVLSDGPLPPKDVLYEEEFYESARS